MIHFGRDIQRKSETRPKEAACTNRKAPYSKNKELQSMLSSMNYLGQLSSYTAEVFEPLRKLTSPKCEWTWKSTYQCLYHRAINIIKKNATMALYNKKENLFLETDALGLSPGVSLLQARDGM